MGIFEGLLGLPIAIVEFVISILNNIFGGIFGIFG